MFPKDPASLKAVLAKTAADQLIWAPVMTCVFFAVLKTLEGHPDMIMSTIEVRSDCCLSCPAEFLLIPPVDQFCLWYPCPVRLPCCKILATQTQ